MKRIVLGNAQIFNGNLGCVALSYCCLYLIDKIVGDGNYKLYLTNSRESVGMHKISILGKDVLYESISIPRYDSIIGAFKTLLLWKKNKHVFSILKNADFFLDIGQGDSFADIYGRERFETVDFVFKTARFFRKPYYILPQTIGPFSNESIKAKAVTSITHASFVMTRDKLSYDYVKAIAPLQEKVREYIDVAFFLPYKKKCFNQQRVHVGLNISAMLWYGGYTKDNQFDLKCEYQTIIRQIISYFLSIPDVTLHLVSHVVGADRNSVENDYAVSYDLFEEYHHPQLLLSPLFLSPIDAKNYISGLDFFMGARMHATIAAFSSGVPVIPMAYSRKFNGLFIDTLKYLSLVDMKKMKNKEIISIIQNSFANRLKLKEIINKIMDGVVKERKEDMIDDLTRLLS